MGEVKAFCLMICAVSLLAVMIRALAPERMQRPIGMLVNLFLLLCLLTPLAHIPHPEFFKNEWRAAEQGTVAGLNTDALLHAEISDRLERASRENLEKNGIFPREIRIDITVADNAVMIQSASIALQPKDEASRERAQVLTEQLLQTEVLVTAAEEVKQ